jgi:predicted amidohydrolase
MNSEMLKAASNFVRPLFGADPLGSERQSAPRRGHRIDSFPVAMTRGRSNGRHWGQTGAVLCTLAVWLAGATANPASAASDSPAPQPGSAAAVRHDRLPRKVLVGTVISGYGITQMPLEKRLRKMDEFVEAIATRAQSEHPGKRLDLVVLPEFFLAQPGDSLAQKTVRLEEVQPRIAACAQRHECYLVVPALLRETEPPERYSNTAVVVDRAGRLVGIYRKVHPVAPQGSDMIEDGTTPGREFPVFDCDFGRLGIQICFDMLYADGWQALARQGAEIVALPSASPETAHPAMYALQHQYYIVSATPRDHAAVFSPLGMIEAQVSEENAVLVHEIDLSFAILHWEAVLEDGEALSRKFGSKVGFHYYRPEDAGIFWSNDPTMSIGQMIGSLGLIESDANVERIRLLQDKARGGPPAAP